MLMFSMRKRGLDSKIFACGAYTWQEPSWSINHLTVLRISIAETNSLLLHRSQIALLEFLGGWLGLAGSLGGLGVSGAVGWETRTDGSFWTWRVAGLERKSLAESLTGASYAGVCETRTEGASWDCWVGSRDFSSLGGDDQWASELEWIVSMAEFSIFSHRLSLDLKYSHIIIHQRHVYQRTWSIR